VTGDLVFERAAALLEGAAGPGWRPLPHQVPPPGRWYGWLLRAGRGAGKTNACTRYVVDHVHGPPCLPGPAPHWVGIIAPTLGDAATSCFSGPSGIRAHDPTARLVHGIGGSEVRWPDGSVAKLFGASSPEDVERLRAGGNRCLVHLEELAAWRYLDACWDQMRFGLRVGPRPHWVASTTPKPRPLIKRLTAGEIAGVVETRASMFDNPHLEEEVRRALLDAYEGTAMGAQELHGELVEQDENALWTRERLEQLRATGIDRDELARVTVGVDPSGGAGEQGIVVVGKRLEAAQVDGRARDLAHGYVLADASCHLSPDGWGQRAVRAAVEWQADDVCVETNYGGAMCVSVLRGAADALGVTIPIRTLTASRGKRPRAEPVAALAERGLWHHVGRFDALEAQMCTWTPESDYSPDRLDAAVWAAWHLKLVSVAPRGAGSFPAAAMSSTRVA
jgi:phage terminase large subunit-like protein